MDDRTGNIIPDGILLLLLSRVVPFPALDFITHMFWSLLSWRLKRKPTICRSSQPSMKSSTLPYSSLQILTGVDSLNPEFCPQLRETARLHLSFPSLHSSLETPGSKLTCWPVLPVVRCQKTIVSCILSIVSLII